MTIAQNASDTPFELSRSEIDQALAPFVGKEFEAGDDATWNALMAKRRRKLRKMRLRRQYLGWLPGAARSPKAVRRIYEKNWHDKNLTRLLDPGERDVPCTWGERRMLVGAPGLKRVYLLHLMRMIEAFQPKSVLEIGCGIGINLLSLAARFPDISFQGIDLTDHGIDAIKNVSAQETLPKVVVDFSPEPLLDFTAHRRIMAQRASAAELPFDDNSFDLVYSVIALEQMEAIRPSVMAQLRRVSSGHVGMLEAFRDWNESGMQRDYIVGQGYFAARIDELPGYGLQPVLVVHDMPVKVNMNLGLVVAKT